MAGVNFPLPFTVGAGSETAGLYFPFGFRLGSSASEQAGLFLPFGFKIGPGSSEEQKPDGAGGHKHVLVFPRGEEERKKVVAELRQPHKLVIDDNEITIDLPIAPDAPIETKTIPESFEIDRELIDLIRLDEQLRYQQLIDAIRKEEETVMQELFLMLLLDA